MIDQGRALFLVGCSSCHGQERRGHHSAERQPVRSAARRRRRRSRRLPGQHRPHAVGPAWRPGTDEGLLYTDEEIAALAAFVASLGPGPAIPEPEQYDPELIPEGDREEAIVRGGEFFRTNCTACHNFAASGGALPGGKYAPSLKGVTPKYIYEAMITGPQQMPVFSDAVLDPEEKRDIIAYLQSIEDAAQVRRQRMGAFGPVSEGLFAWLVGIGPASASPSGSPPAPRAPRREQVVTDHSTEPRHGPSRPTSRSPNPACTSTSLGRPTSTMRPRSAPSARSPTMFGLSPS